MSIEGTPVLPCEWRIPPWQPAALFLAVSALLALDIYGHPSLRVLIVTGFLAVVFLCLAVPAARYLLVADEDGVWVRGLLSERGMRWRELRDIDLVDGRRGAGTMRIYRVDGTFLDVPPSLLLPTLPTKIERARGVIRGVAGQLEMLAAERRDR